MHTIFINSTNRKTSSCHRVLLNLSDKINLKWSYKYVTLSNFSNFFKWKNIRMLYKNNKFKIPPTWNEEFELPDGSYSTSDIQDYFEYIIKHQKVANNPPIRINI